LKKLKIRICSFVAFMSMTRSRYPNPAHLKPNLKAASVSQMSLLCLVGGGSTHCAAAILLCHFWPCWVYCYRGYSLEELEKHISLLHEYNDIKDAGQMLLGKLGKEGESCW